MIQFDAIQKMKGKRALITGGSKGIGACIAEMFASVGVDVAIMGLHDDELVHVKQEVEKYNQKCWTIKADLSHISQIQKAADEILSYSNTWDIVIHSAGIAIAEPLLDVREETWDKIHNVNVRSFVFLCQKIVPKMIEKGSGKIVMISSLGAFIGTPGLGAYSASKAALNQLTRTMACEWGPHNIQVNTICPTIVLTDMGKAIWDNPLRAHEKEAKLGRIPLHRFAEPKDVANLALFLASSGSDYLNGVCIPLEGGLLGAP